MVMGILALVFGLCGAIIFPVMGFFNLFALLAVIFGGVQLKRTRTDPARFGGRGPAKAGLVMGLIIYGIAIIGTVFWMVVLSGTSA